MPFPELFLALQFVSTGVEVSPTAMPLKLLAVEVQFVIVGWAEPVTCMPCAELSMALQFVSTGVEVRNTAMPQTLFPVDVQFVIIGRAEPVT
jgi:fibronectin type 3 domain-containing protein